MVKIQLTEAERSELRKTHKGLRDAKSRDRIKAILMLDDRYTLAEIAKGLLLEEKTIRRWRDRYLSRKDLTDYLLSECRGYEGKLSREQKDAITEHVENNLIADSKQVRKFIEEELGISYSKSRVVELLHELGFRYKQTSIVPSKMDPEKQAEFKKAYDEFSENLKTTKSSYLQTVCTLRTTSKQEKLG